jgi:hypothetical protein
MQSFLLELGTAVTVDCGYDRTTVLFPRYRYKTQRIFFCTQITVNNFKYYNQDCALGSQ